MNRKGITLIALIITVVILIILAGTAIAIGLNGGDLLKKTENAGKRWSMEQEKEIISFTTTLASANNIGTKLGKEQLENALQGYNVTVQIKGNTPKVIFNDTNRKYRIKLNGEVVYVNEKSLTDVYATLYKDGTLTLSSNKDVIEGKEIEKQFDKNIGKLISYTKSDLPWFENSEYASKIKKVDIINEIAPKNMQFWFSGLTELESIENIENLNTSNVVSMWQTFCDCKNLKELDVSKFETGNVASFMNVFTNCRSLTELNVSGFDTSNVTSMYNVFGNCKGLTSIDVSNFDTSNATSMAYMFTGCDNLINVDVSNFNTSKVTVMDRMFTDCKKIEKLDVKNWDTSNVTSMFFLFNCCSSVSKLEVENWNTAKVRDIGGMFSNCKNLTSLNINNWDIRAVTKMASTPGPYGTGGLFEGCSNLTEINLSTWDTNAVTNMAWLFKNCTSLRKIDITEFDMDNVEEYREMLKNVPAGLDIVASEKTKSWLNEKALEIGYMK